MTTSFSVAWHHDFSWDGRNGRRNQRRPPRRDWLHLQGDHFSWEGRNWLELQGAWNGREDRECW